MSAAGNIGVVGGTLAMAAGIFSKLSAINFTGLPGGPLIAGGAIAFAGGLSLYFLE